MIYLNEYVKEKTNELVNAFFKASELQNEQKGKMANKRKKYYDIDVDIDDDYMLKVDYVYTWKIIYKESKAELCSIQELGMNALPELMKTFTENVIEDYILNYEDL